MAYDLLSRLRSFLRAEAVLVIAAVAALASCAIYPLTPATAPTYAGYIDLRTIALLFCLMTVVAGFGRAGALDRVRTWLTGRTASARRLALLLINVVFATSMLVTNDVALITFVPLALALFMDASPRTVIAVVVSLTVAANLGSLCTPIGNPQNIYLVSAYQMDMAAFFRTVAPLGIASYICCIALVALVPDERLQETASTHETTCNARLLSLYGLLFGICIACVARLIRWEPCCIAVVAACLAFDRRVFSNVDYSLLATFVCFFIFVGNLGQAPAVAKLLSSAIAGREILVSALASQVISNVPAAIMLSGFTDNAQALLVGTNIGGLGTPVASLASLISLRIYAAMPHAQTKRYLLWFAIVNVSLLAILLGCSLVVAPYVL